MAVEPCGDVDVLHDVDGADIIRDSNKRDDVDSGHSSSDGVVQVKERSTEHRPGEVSHSEHVGEGGGL